MRKAARPETQSQARTWDGNYVAYKAAGFCKPCASHAAWGHQIGWALADPIGDCCRGKSTPRASERAERWVNHQPDIET